jgi:hypothetical protein
MTHTNRILRAGLLAALALAACAATANAAGINYDAGYGTKLLPTIAGSPFLPANDCESINNHSLAISAQLRGGSRPASKSRQVTAILIANTNNPGARKWRPVKSSIGEQIVGSDFSPSGDFAYVDSPVLDRKATKFVVRKVGTDGKSFPGWHDAAIRLAAPAKGGSYKDVSVLNLRDGGVLVSISRFDAVRVFRFTKSGARANFGVGGVVETARMEPSSWFAANHGVTPLVENGDGTLLVAAPGRPRLPRVTSGIGLLKLDKSGVPVDGFADHGFWTPPKTLGDETSIPSDSKTLAGETLGVIGGEGTGLPLTVLFGMRVEFTTGIEERVATAQLSDAGLETAFSKPFDTATNAGDGGFPDAIPFDFKRTQRGYTYAAAWSQLRDQNSGSSFGKVVGLGPLLAPPIRTQTIDIAKAKFMAWDFAATADGKYVYACGGVRPTHVKSGTVSKAYSPALRVFKL